MPYSVYTVEIEATWSQAKEADFVRFQLLNALSGNEESASHIGMALSCLMQRRCTLLKSTIQFKDRAPLVVFPFTINENFFNKCINKLEDKFRALSVEELKIYGDTYSTPDRGIYQ